MNNLRHNINKRVIKGGKWEPHYDEKGNMKKISLNKDDAYSMLAPPPSGKESEFGEHIFKGVIPKRPITLTVSQKVRDRLHLVEIPYATNHYDMVRLIWDSLYTVIRIVKSEPTESMRGENGAPYSKDTIDLVTQHLERFRILFLIRYTAKKLTPYARHFIDYVPEMMRSFPFPLNRYQCEGSEAMNHASNIKHFL